MSKAPPSWSLRYKSPTDFPNIAKFADEIDWANAKKPMQMYFKEEELKEDETAEVVKDAEYYKRKRNQRRAYRKKNALVLEDSSDKTSSGNGDATGVRFEGRLCNLGLADIEDAKSKAQNREDAPFRYVLLQFIKKENDGASGSNSSGGNEINVIPVGDMFAFKKASLIADELLVDIDERFIQERQRSKDNINRYKGINSSLTQAERSRLGLGPGEGGDGAGLSSTEFLGGFDSTSLFGASVNKSSGSNGGGGGRGGGGKQSNVSNNNNDSYLNENGIDMDELRADEDAHHGDYSTRFADDEEEYVVLEQGRNQEMADMEMSVSQRYAEDLEEGVDDDDEDEDEEDNEEDEVGMVDDSMVSNAAEARKLFISKPAAKAITMLTTSSGAVGIVAIAAAVGGGSGAVPVKSALKRSREEMSSSSSSAAAGGAGGAGGAEPAMKSRVSFGDVGSAGATADATATGDSGASPAVGIAAAARKQAADTAVSTEYPLTEQGLRRFITNRGGRVTYEDMKVIN